MKRKEKIILLRRTKIKINKKIQFLDAIASVELHMSLIDWLTDVLLMDMMKG